MFPKIVFVAKKKLVTKRIYPSIILTVHSNKECGVLQKAKKFDGIAEMSDTDATKHQAKLCAFCSKQTIAKPAAVKPTRVMPIAKGFSPPLTAHTNTNINLPMNLTESVTINGMKYIRDDIAKMPKVHGIIVMEDGKEYNLTA